jgi:LPS export ABC transporter protein LptC
MITSCENSWNEILKVSVSIDAEVEIADNIEILYSTDAHVRARLVSKELKRFNTRKPYLEFNKGLQVTFFDEQLVQSSKLTAGYGRVDELSNEMIARNNVVVINNKGEKLNTEELIWDNKNKKIFSEQFVTIQTKDEILYGDGLEANEDMTNYKIKKIRGTIQVKEEVTK